MKYKLSLKVCQLITSKVIIDLKLLLEIDDNLSNVY